jgi:hypothetical protein
MLAGIAPKAGARVLFDRGADVSHFRYFTNHDTRAALRDWLTRDKPRELTMFRPLPEHSQALVALQRVATRDAQAADRPVVVVIPGVMGSHLRVNSRDRVWFDPLDIASGGLEKIAWDRPQVEAEGLFAMSYGRLCNALAESHRVESFPYDWRQPLMSSPNASESSSPGSCARPSSRSGCSPTAWAGSWFAPASTSVAPWSMSSCGATAPGS